MWRWWTLQYGCYCWAFICRVSNCCLSLYLHVAGDYNMVLENTGSYFGQDSGNSGCSQTLLWTCHSCSTECICLGTLWLQVFGCDWLPLDALLSMMMTTMMSWFFVNYTNCLCVHVERLPCVCSGFLTVRETHNTFALSVLSLIPVASC